MAEYQFNLGNNIIGYINPITYNNTTYYEISIEGSGAMYEDRSDFTVPAGQSVNSWASVVQRCKQDVLVIPSGITTIANSCFEGLGDHCGNRFGVAGVNSVILGSSVYKIGNYAFRSEYNSGLFPRLTSFIVMGSVEQIGVRAFEFQSDLPYIDFHNTVTKLEAGVFNGCWNIEYLNLSDDWEFYGENLITNQYTFCNCYKLHTISPKNVIHGFYRENYNNCNSLQNIHIKDPDEYEAGVGSLAFRVEKNAGTVLDDEGYFITEVNTTNKAILAYDWKSNWNRIIVIYYDMTIHLFHMGKHIEIGVYDSGDLPLVHEEKIYYLRWKKLNNKKYDPNQTPLFVTHNGSWYQIQY